MNEENEAQRIAVIGTPEFHSHALAYLLTQVVRKNPDMWTYNTPEVCYDRVGCGLRAQVFEFVEKDLDEVQKLESKPVMVFCAPDFFGSKLPGARLDQYLEQDLHYGPPKCWTVVLVDPRDSFMLKAGLAWRKLFARVLVDVFASDWDPLAKILHVDFPGFQALVDKIMAGPRDGETGIMLVRDREFGSRLEVCRVESPEVDEE
jgi:hypothetical protein